MLVTRASAGGPAYMQGSPSGWALVQAALRSASVVASRHAVRATFDMSLPDVRLPFDFTLPTPDPSVVLTVALCGLLGGFAVDVALTLRPFARRRRSRERAVFAVVGLAAGCFVLGAAAHRAPSTVAAGAVAAAACALAYWWVLSVVEREAESADLDVLPDDELRRDKTASDRWVLVTGPAGAGKTSLVEGMVAGAGERRAGRARRAVDGALRATELAIRNARGEHGALRLWEAPAITRAAGRLPRLGDFDAVVLAIDPTQHAPIAESFPGVLRGAAAPTDANGRILQLAEALRGECFVWAVVTKADILRLSVHPALLEFPLQVGPGWHRQVRDMDVGDRRRLAEAMELPEIAREHEPAFAWGTRSPLLASTRSSNGRGTFGGAELMEALIEALWPGWSRP